MSRTVEEILGKDAIAALRRPIAEARGLPSVAYTGDEFFELEQQRLFARTWTCIAFAHEVPEPGDAMPMMVAGLPIILLRDDRGKIRTFHNVCRHRATMVLREAKSGLSELQCPYHHWTYGLDGGLKAAPFFNGPTAKPIGTLDLSKNGLVSVRTGVWHQFVFVNLSGDAPPLEEYLAPLSELYADYDLDVLRAGYTMSVEIKSNWKLLPDNWENYHAAYLHGKYFEMKDFFKNDELTYEDHTDGCYMANITPAANRRKREHKFPLIPGPPEDERRGLSTHVFPNTTMTMPSDHFAPVIYTPIAPDRTVAKMAWFFVGDAATSPELADAREQCIDRWFGHSRSIEGLDGIRNEDYDLMQTQQIARLSPVANQVQFSPYWESLVHHFQNKLIDAMM